jgi:hypothetical protein
MALVTEALNRSIAIGFEDNPSHHNQMLLYSALEVIK